MYIWIMLMYLNVINERQHPTGNFYITYNNNHCYNYVYGDCKIKEYAATYIKLCACLCIEKLYFYVG